MKQVFYSKTVWFVVGLLLNVNAHLVAAGELRTNKAIVEYARQDIQKELRNIDADDVDFVTCTIKMNHGKPVAKSFKINSTRYRQPATFREETLRNTAADQVVKVVYRNPKHNHREVTLINMHPSKKRQLGQSKTLEFDQPIYA